MINFANFAAPFSIVCALVLAISGPVFMGQSTPGDYSVCPLEAKRSLSFRIAWAEPKMTPLPSLVLRNHVADHNFLFVCSSSQCLISISKDNQDGTRKETI